MRNIERSTCEYVMWSRARGIKSTVVRVHGIAMTAWSATLLPENSRNPELVYIPYQQSVVRAERATLFAPTQDVHPRSLRGARVLHTECLYHRVLGDAAHCGDAARVSTGGEQQRISRLAPLDYAVSRNTRHVEDAWQRSAVHPVCSVVAISNHASAACKGKKYK